MSGSKNFKVLTRSETEVRVVGEVRVRTESGKHGRLGRIMPWTVHFTISFLSFTVTQLSREPYKTFRVIEDSKNVGSTSLIPQPPRSDQMVLQCGTHYFPSVTVLKILSENEIKNEVDRSVPRTLTVLKKTYVKLNKNKISNNCSLIIVHNFIWYLFTYNVFFLFFKHIFILDRDHSVGFTNLL